MAGASVAAKKAASIVAKPFSAIPGPKLYPILGNLPQYIFGQFDRLKYQQALISLHKEYGPIVKQNLGGRDTVHVFEPDDIKTVSYPSRFKIGKNIVSRS